MTLSSAATPTYFFPVEINGKFYISGENVAASPAMYAFMTATDKNGIAPEQVTVVSVGTTNALPDAIDKKVGLLDWAQRLLTLNAPVKMHTMDYMTNFLLRSKDRLREGSRFHKFDINVDSEFEEDFYFNSGSRDQLLSQKSQELIFENMFEVNRVLHSMVTDKFTCAK